MAVSLIDAGLALRMSTVHNGDRTGWLGGWWLGVGVLFVLLVLSIVSSCACFLLL